MGSQTDLRQNPRMAIALAVRVRTSLGVVETTTVNVSRGGLRAHIMPPPPIASEVHVSIALPNGVTVDGIGRCRTRLPAGVCGLQLSFTGESRTHWHQFIDEEEATGGLWRMIGRAAMAPDDALAPRRVQETVAADQLQFHTVGENGEAYRIAFERHPTDTVETCDLAETMPGFRELARRLISEVLREPLTLKLDDRSAPVTVRVAQIQVGGYAWIQGDATVRASLIALTGGELVLVARNGQSVFPHFTPDELERIACDTFRGDTPGPAFGRTGERRVVNAEQPSPNRPAPVDMPAPEALSGARPDARPNGFDAIRHAQSASTDAQIRRYGDKDIFFYPSVWARVRDGGQELMGPTMHDGFRVSVLALVGAGTPRVVQIDQTSDVALLKQPGR